MYKKLIDLASVKDDSEMCSVILIEKGRIFCWILHTHLLVRDERCPGDKKHHLKPASHVVSNEPSSGCNAQLKMIG